MLKTHEFYLRSYSEWCLLLLAPGYALGILLGEVYLREVLYQVQTKENKCGIIQVLNDTLKYINISILWYRFTSLVQQFAFSMIFAESFFLQKQSTDIFVLVLKLYPILLWEISPSPPFIFYKPYIFLIASWVFTHTDYTLTTTQKFCCLQPPTTYSL